MMTFINHTDEVKRRIEAIFIRPEDSCTFFSQEGKDADVGKNCANCRFSVFKKENSDGVASEVEGSGRCHYGIAEEHEGASKPDKAQENFDAFVSNMNGGVITCIFDSRTQSSKPVYVNEGWTVITGYTLEQLNREKGGNPQALVLPADKKNTDLAYMEQAEKGREYDLLYRLARRDGKITWVIDRGLITFLENGDVQNQSIIIDITEIKEREERLRRLAQTDQLTELNNKTTSASMAQEILKRYRTKEHAAMVIDIDNFKGINDTRGHAFGDTVLREVSGCLKGLFRNMDILGRIGGDEFTVLMTTISSQEEAEKKAKAICEAMHELHTENGEKLQLSVSIGIAFSSGEEDYGILFEQADQALYEAKKKGKDQYCVYSVTEESAV